MLDLWLENGPPVYISVAAYMGMSNDGSKSKDKGPGDLNELAKLAGLDGMIQ